MVWTELWKELVGAWMTGIGGLLLVLEVGLEYIDSLLSSILLVLSITVVRASVVSGGCKLIILDLIT